MTTSISGSATIYTFPPRGRFAIGSQIAGQRNGEMAASAAAAPAVRIASGSGWYHDAAILEANADPRGTN